MKPMRQKLSARSIKTGIGLSDQHGYILIIGMLALCLLSFLGIWALSSSDYEFKIASNLQTLEKNFNIAEGAAKQEGAGVGFARSSAGDWYEISDPETFNQFLLPPAGSYDPGGDITSGGTYPDDFVESNYDTWPRQNLLKNNADNLYDYAYLVTYLYPDNPPKGYDASMFSGYRFRITADKKVVVEIGGIKVGVKAGI